MAQAARQSTASRTGAAAERPPARARGAGPLGRWLGLVAAWTGAALTLALGWSAVVPRERRP